jgi:4-aminobutyrate aminotransferase-like enzyme
LIVLTAGTCVSVIRIMPPLVTTADEVAVAIPVLAERLTAARA